MSAGRPTPPFRSHKHPDAGSRHHHRRDGQKTLYLIRDSDALVLNVNASPSVLLVDSI